MISIVNMEIVVRYSPYFSPVGTFRYVFYCLLNCSLLLKNVDCVSKYQFQRQTEKSTIRNTVACVSKSSYCRRLRASFFAVRMYDS